ncbi:MAG TPA: RNA polymerase sigma factor [Flavitalea sp.]|nr:RNA polymerase sigma factor [Flavitalea sp.]
MIYIKPYILQVPEYQKEFIRLVHEHRPMLLKVCNVYCHSEFDRQDLFQEIVIQLWKSFPKFRGESKFSTWLYRIALNTAISDLRRQKKNITLIEPANLPGDIEDIQYYKQKEEQLQQLHSAIEQLTEIEKAITMLYLEDKSYEEMEEILGISQNNLRVKMNRIKEKLRKLTKSLEHGIG